MHIDIHCAIQPVFVTVTPEWNTIDLGTSSSQYRLYKTYVGMGGWAINHRHSASLLTIKPATKSLLNMNPEKARVVSTGPRLSTRNIEFVGIKM